MNEPLLKKLVLVPQLLAPEVHPTARYQLIRLK